MPKFLECRSLSPEELAELEEEIERRIAEKKKQSLLTTRNVREIEEMRLHPLPDIQDVQSVFEDHLFREKRRKKE